VQEGGELQQQLEQEEEPENTSSYRSLSTENDADAVNRFL
jgi:hypothetical protein